MKWLLIALLLVAPAITQAQLTGQASTDRLPDVTRVSSTDGYVGQLAPLTYTETVTLPKGGTSATTRWFQIGWAPTGSFKSNTSAMQFNPEKFTVILSDFTPVPADTSDNDSVGIGYARFALAYDTTADNIWLGDTSNAFIENSVASRADYGTWTFKPFKRRHWVLPGKTIGDTTDFAYPIKVTNGAYIRFMLKGWNNTDNGSILDDSCTVKIRLIGER